MDKDNNKGFTLGELLIVVGIIAVLVAISIPIFSGLVQKAHLATNQANARAGYAAVMAAYDSGDTSKCQIDGNGYAYEYDCSKGTVVQFEGHPDWNGVRCHENFASWGVKDGRGNRTLGKVVFSKWYYYLTKDGTFSQLNRQGPIVGDTD